MTTPTESVAAENPPVVATEPTREELAQVERWVRVEGRRRVREKMDAIDAKNKGTPRTRLPWES